MWCKLIYTRWLCPKHALVKQRSLKAPKVQNSYVQKLCLTHMAQDLEELHQKKHDVVAGVNLGLDLFKDAVVPEVPSDEEESLDLPDMQK